MHKLVCLVALALAALAACAPPPSSARFVECTGLKGPQFDCELYVSSYPADTTRPAATWATGGAWTEGPNTEIAITLTLERLAPGANTWDYLWDETRQANGVRSFSWTTTDISCGPGEYRWYMRVRFGSDPTTTYYKIAGDILFP